MSYLFLASFIAGLLLAVRLMFFGAERRRHRTTDTSPLRRFEPATVAFLLVFGVAGYLTSRHGSLSAAGGAATAVMVGAVVATIVTWLAIATARIRPEHDSEDPRYIYQGRVGVVSIAIPVDGEGMIRYEDPNTSFNMRARDISGGAIGVNEEVCIERIEDGVAYVELWASVERRL